MVGVQSPSPKKKSPPMLQAGKWQWSRYLLEMAQADATTYDEAGVGLYFWLRWRGGKRVDIRDMCHICTYTPPGKKAGKDEDLHDRLGMLYFTCSQEMN